SALRAAARTVALRRSQCPARRTMAPTERRPNAHRRTACDRARESSRAALRVAYSGETRRSWATSCLGPASLLSCTNRLELGVLHEVFRMVVYYITHWTLAGGRRKGPLYL